MSDNYKYINKLAIGISITGVSLIILGMLFSAGLAETSMRYWGAYLLSSGVGVLILYYFGTFLYLITRKSTSLLSQLITFYIGVTALMIIGGLVAAIFKVPLGMTLFLSALGMFGLFWVGVLIYFIFKKEK